MLDLTLPGSGDKQPIGQPGAIQLKPTLTSMCFCFAQHCRNVVTCEPGLYFIKPLLDKAAADRRQASLINIDAARKLVPLGGVRIEDDVLVAKKGPFNITMEAGVPKAMAEIEEIMKQQYVPMFV